MSNRGGILILTFWLIVFLSTLVMILGAQILTQRQAIAAYADRVQGSLALETMRARFQVALKLDKTTHYDALSDSWSQDPDLFKEVRMGKDHGPSVSLAVNSLHGAIDEERFVNINKASVNLLKNLFMADAGLDEKRAALLANAVQDWRDLDVISSNPEVDTEGALYAAYPSKNDLFESREELMLVYGMDETIYKAIEPMITIYGEGQVNLNTAPPEVLHALGAPDSLVDKIVRFRSGDDQVVGTKDDGFFEDVQSVEPKLQSRWGNLSTDEINALNRMKSENWLGVQSKFFRLPVEMKSHGKVWRKSMVLDREGKVWEIRR